MTDAILCPQCEKRFKLPEHPPATFTCTQCGTLIDLSAFGGGQAPPASPSPSAGGGGPRRSSGGGRRRRAPAPRGAGPRAQKQQQAPVMAIVVVVLVVVVLVAVRSGGDDEPRRKKKTSDAPKKTTSFDLPDPTPAPTPADTSTAAAKNKKRKEPKKNNDGTYKLRLSSVKLKALDWPEDVSDDIRQQTEASIKALYGGGREASEAEAWLIDQGRPIAGRLISEFAAIQESPGFDNRDGTSMAMQIDAVLHKIDGFMERSIGETGTIKSTGHYAAPSFIRRTGKRWTWWWESGEWQENPKKPWDPFEDESDETPDGRKPTEPKKDPKKGSGFKKRAGSG